MNRMVSEDSYSYSTEDESTPSTRFTKRLPQNAIKVKSFNNWKFEDLYFHNDTGRPRICVASRILLTPRRFYTYKRVALR